MQPTKVIDKYLSTTLMTAFGASTIWGLIEGHIINAWNADWQGEIASIAAALCCGVMAGEWLVRHFEMSNDSTSTGDELIVMLARCHDYEIRLNDLKDQLAIKESEVDATKRTLHLIQEKLESNTQTRNTSLEEARAHALLLDADDKWLLTRLGDSNHMDTTLEWSELSDQLELLGDCVEFTEVGTELCRVWITEYGRFVLNAAQDVFDALDANDFDPSVSWWLCDAAFIDND